jgi:hypothetical protein
MSPPSRMPRHPAAQMPPALTLALMHTGLSDAALSALVPRRQYPDDADVQFSTEPPDDDSSSNAIIPPSTPLLLCMTTNLHALLLHNNRLTTACCSWSPSPPSHTATNVAVGGVVRNGEEVGGGGSALGDLILAAPSLQVLSLHNNSKLCNHTAVAGKLLAEAITPHRCPLPPTSRAMKNSNTSALCTLYLSNIGLGDEGVAEFARVAFPRLTSLTKCSLGGNRITDRGAVSIHRWMTTSSQRQSCADGRHEEHDDDREEVVPPMYANFNAALTMVFDGGAAALTSAALRPPPRASWTRTTRLHLKALETLDLPKNLIGGDGALWLSTLGIRDLALR